jgi:hypothetical protein
MLCVKKEQREILMKNNLAFSLLSAALIVLPALAHADQTQFDVLRVYRLASGQGVAVAIPGEWRELSATRTLAARAPALFMDESGRQFEITAVDLERAAATKSIAWPTGPVKAKLARRESF